eukprot:754498-Hanusia_phi.AAC.1
MKGIVTSLSITTVHVHDTERYRSPTPATPWPPHPSRSKYCKDAGWPTGAPPEPTPRYMHPGPSA